MAQHKMDDGDRSKRLTKGDKTSSSADDVDLTLIRWMLSLSPEDRLKTLQKHIQSIQRLRDAQSDA